MDSTSIDLVGSKITEVSVEGTTVKVRFEPAYLIKTMTGSVERTRWWQNGNLVFEGAELDDAQPLPQLPAACRGGDVGENVYTYRDMVPVPLESVGRAHCDLKVEGSDAPIRVHAEAVTLELEDVAKYIEHLRPE
jgi:hypothetical protein